MQVVPLSAAADAGKFGGKTSDLCAVLAQGLPVPPGFAVDAELVETIATTSHAAPLVAELSTALPERVAVRSSGIGEDSSNASFAGQHKTLLNVDARSGLARAITEVWRSAHQPAALAYRERLGLEQAVRIAVLIQPMLPADVAGVLFTKNPITGADERVVEATWGLGESVVMGLVTPDLFRLARGGALLEARVGVKDLAVRCSPAGGTEEAPIEAADVMRPCLSPERLAALDALATRCEAVFDDPRDLEWAFVGDELFLLQCRAVTR